MKQAMLVPQIKDMSLPKIQLTNDKFLIGRGLQNTQVIEDVNISRSHCIFIHKDGCWYLLDKSSNGTWLNGNLLDKTKEYKLLHGDLIVLSNNVKFEYQICSDDNSQNSQTVGEKNTNTEEIDDNLKAGVYVGKLNGNALSQLDLENTTNLSKMTTSNVEAQPETKALPDAKLSGLTYAEDELQCSICTEMFIKAVTLSCSHTFCKYCITQWRKNQTICPICRAEIKMEFSTLVLDNFINKIVENAGDDLKEHRNNLMKERESDSSSAPGPSGNRRRRPASDPIEISSSDSSSDHDDEDDDEEEEEQDLSSIFRYSYSEEDDDEDEDWFGYDYNGVPGYYYGGYGSCYNCGQRGHWSNGCPTKRRR